MLEVLPSTEPFILLIEMLNLAWKKLLVIQFSSTILKNPVLRIVGGAVERSGQLSTLVKEENGHT